MPDEIQPVVAETPVEPQGGQPTEVTETQATEPQQAATGVYELPDGRKLSGEQVRDEYLKLNSEFTRRSQELASLKNPNKPAQQEDGLRAEALKGKSEQEILEAIIAASEQKVRASLDNEAKAKTEEQARAQAEVNAEITELKKLDANVDAEMVCAHAVKYGFPSLKQAYQNMVDFKVAKSAAERKAVEAMKSRETGVSGPAAGSGTDSSDQFRNMIEGRDISARDFLKRLKS
jgi:membrane protein involved in colicin uptake